MENTDYKKFIPYLISECNEDVDKLKSLKYDLIEKEISLKNQLSDLERDERGFCYDTKSFNKIKTSLQYIQRYLLQVSDILKSLSYDQYIEKTKDNVIKQMQIKNEREQLKHERHLEKQKQLEFIRDAKHQRELERLEKHNQLRIIENDINIKRQKLFINSIKPYVNTDLWDNIWIQVDLEIPKR